ncbi:MAG TPA: carbohydrate binding family 9 domain-containing protein, partial [Vicinamibacteria bacterium]
MRPCLCLLAPAPWLLTAAAGAAAGDGHASLPKAPDVIATRAASAIVVDGRLDDAAWRAAAPAVDFRQRDPDEGKPATEPTELRIAYDNEALYVGARMRDREPKRIVRRLSRRDGSVDADRIRIYLDPRHDHLTGVVFEVSAGNVQGDSAIFNDSWDDSSWDGVWTSAVTLDDEGWTAELRVPFSELRFPSAERQTWGINAERYIQRKNESDWL